jgi:hypothetical protein
MVTACFPMMRWSSLTCFSNSRTRLDGTTSSSASTAAALPCSLSLIHFRMRAGATLNSRESAAAVVSPDRIRSTICRLNSVVKIRRPSDFLSNSAISTHLSGPILGLKGVQPNRGADQARLGSDPSRAPRIIE